MIAVPKLLSVGFLSIGIFLLLQVILPIISFQMWMVGQNLSHQILVSPTGSSSQVLGISVENRDSFPAFISTLKRDTQPSYQEFKISIPKIDIADAQVLVDSNDLSNSLAHLPGSALPGEKGNVFISGHSALSPLFSLKKAVFGRLLDLKKGDQIQIWAGGTKFVYEIMEMKAVDPKDLSVIAPPEPQGRYITLMTCVPPGLNLKRLIVLGKMI